MFIISRLKQKYIDIGTKIGYEKAINESNEYLNEYVVPYYKEYINGLYSTIRILAQQDITQTSPITQKQTIKPSKPSKSTQLTKNTTEKQILNITIEEIMSWLKTVIEIAETKFFKSTYFELVSLKEIKNIIEYLDYINHTFEYKTLYPHTYPHVNIIKKSIEEAYNKKLLAEEAQKLF